VCPTSILHGRSSGGLPELSNPIAGESTHSKLRRAPNPRGLGEFMRRHVLRFVQNSSADGEESSPLLRS
ncbi:hypothetical protein A2U01_0084301, partial [Trifolium medium]|nr:hypothetical protein [Trifolium medium]